MSWLEVSEGYEEPKNLLLHNARPCARAGSAPPQALLVVTQTGSENGGWATNGAAHTTPYP